MADLGRRVVTEGFVYLAGTAIASAAGFVCVIVYARSLGLEAYGEYALLIAVSSALSSVMMLGGDVVLSRFFFDAQDAAGKQDFAWTWILFLTGWSAVVAAVAVIASAALADLLGLDGGSVPLLWLAIAALVPDQTGRLLAQVLRVHFQPFRYITATALPVVLGSGLGVLVVGVAGWGLAGAVLGVAVTAALSVLVAGGLAWRNLAGTFRYELIGPAVRFGLPLVPATMAFWVFRGLDRIVLDAQMTASAVGLYALAAQLVTPMGLISTAVAQAWMPRILQANESSPTAAVDATYRASQIALVAYGTIAVMVSLAAPALVTWVGGPDYADAAQAMPALATGMAFLGVSVFASTAAVIAKRTALSPVITVGAAALDLLLLFLLVPRIGLTGAGLALMAAYFAMLVGAMAYSRAVNPGAWQPWALVLGCAALLLQALVASLTHDNAARWIAQVAALAALGFVGLQTVRQASRTTASVG